MRKNFSLILDNFDDKTCCILEFKKAESLDKCINTTQEATAQIITKNYAEEFIGKHNKKVYGLGIFLPKIQQDYLPWQSCSGYTTLTQALIKENDLKL